MMIDLRPILYLELSLALAERLPALERHRAVSTPVPTALELAALRSLPDGRALANLVLE